MATFKELAVHESFEFMPSKDGFHHDKNLYQKTGTRTYRRLDQTGGAITGAYRVGTIHVTVQRVAHSIKAI